MWAAIHPGPKGTRLSRRQRCKLSFFSGGEPHEKFITLFNQETLLKAFVEIFGEGMDLPVVVYGEAYGGKQQGMSHTYGTVSKFIVFDIQVGNGWLPVPQADKLTKNLGLEFVHWVKIPTEMKYIDAERDADSVQAIRNGIGSGKMREGIVLRPPIEVESNGKRVISKYKRAEFSEHAKPPKVVDPARMEVLSNAQAIADQWVVAMRLEHILQEHPDCTGIEHTAKVIKAMIADIYKEGKGEIIESKDSSAAIAKKTAELWKKKINIISKETMAKILAEG